MVADRLSMTISLRLAVFVATSFCYLCCLLSASSSARRESWAIINGCRHAIVHSDLQMAFDLSDLLRGSVGQGSRKNLCALLMNALTRCSWMKHKCETVKVKSVVKYMCGIRLAHLLEGLGGISRATLSCIRP